MARFYTDFSEYSKGTAPHDWREQWIVGGQTLEVMADADATGGAVLRHVIHENNRRAYAWQRVDGASIVEIAARIRATDADARFGVIGRGAGCGSVRDNEYGFTSELEAGRHTADRRPAHEGENNPQFSTRSYDARQKKSPQRIHGTGQLNGVTSFSWVPGQWYWVRLRLTQGSEGVDVVAKVWSGGPENEPAEWHHRQANSEPADVGSDGWVGITGQTTAGTRDYDVFAVGTDGDSAPLTP